MPEPYPSNPPISQENRPLSRPSTLVTAIQDRKGLPREPSRVAWFGQ